MKTLRDLQTAIVAGIKTGDYGLLDTVLEESSDSGDSTTVGAYDPFGVFARELKNAVSEKCNPPVEPETRPSVLGELHGGGTDEEVAGEEQRSGVQRDVQTEMQGSDKP